MHYPMIRHVGIAAAIIALVLGSGASRAQKDVKLGAFLPVTGVTADIGAQMKAGFEVAIERANAEPNNPYKINVIWYDDENKADVGLNIVTRALTLDKINVAVGFLSSDIFSRVMDEFQKAKVPVVDCCAASLGIGDKIAKNNMIYVFQLSPTASDIANSLLAALEQWVKPSKVGFLNENVDTGRDFSRISRAWLKQNTPSVDIVADEFVEKGSPDMTAPLAKLKRLGAQAIIGEIVGSASPLEFEQWYELKVPAVIAHMGAAITSDTFIAQNAKYMDRAIVNYRWWPARYSDISEPMMEAYKKKTGSGPTNFAVQAHDAALVMIEAIRKAQSLDPDKISAALAETTFTTAWGNREFTALSDGHRMPIQTVVVQIQKGKKVPIYPEAVAKAAGGKFESVPPYAWQEK
jgi:branched-chain amino acid transport system substrate-binding protein